MRRLLMLTLPLFVVACQDQPTQPLLAPDASLAWTVDTEGYMGSVGKGEVQTALGWNDATLQTNAEDLAFRHVQRDHYQLYCQRPEDGDVRLVNRQEVTNTFLDYQTRTNPQGRVTGFDFVGVLNQVENDNMTCPSGYLHRGGTAGTTYLGTTYELYVRHVFPGAAWYEIPMPE
jgi:hypothetical protein